MIVAVSGSLRARSSNGALLRAIARIDPRVWIYEGLGSLPHFNPDLDEEGMEPPEPVRERLLEAEAVILSSPEYAHGVPGSLKNMLDWLVSVGELVGTRVALLNAARVGGEHAQAALAETLRTMNWNVVVQARVAAADEAELRKALGALV